MNEQVEVIIEQQEFEEKLNCEIIGLITSQNGYPIPELTITAYHKTIDDRSNKGKKIAAAASTNNNGYYRIDFSDFYQKSQQTYHNIYIEIKDGPLNNNSERSALSPRAFQTVVIDHQLAVDYHPPSEYQQLSQKLKRQAYEKPIAELNDDDIAIVSSDTNIDSDKVRLLVTTEQLHQQIKSLAGVAQNKVESIKPGSLFALLKDNAVDSIQQLATMQTDTIKASIQHAIESNTVSHSETLIPATLINRLGKLYVYLEKSSENETELLSITDVIKSAPFNKQSSRNKLIQKSLNNKYQLIKTLDSSEFKANKIFLLEQLSLKDLTLSNKRLVEKINGDINNKRIKSKNSIADFAKFNEKDWLNYFNNKNIKAVALGKDKNYTLKQFSQDLTQQFKTAYPAIHFVSQINDLVPQGKKPTRLLKAFMDENTRFNLGKDSISEYIASNKTIKLNNKPLKEQQKQSLAKELRVWQRLYKLAGNDNKREQKVSRLLVMQDDDGQPLDSAIKVADLDYSEFLKRWNNAPKRANNIALDLSEDDAKAVYYQAKNTQGMISTLSLHFLEPVVSQVEGMVVNPVSPLILPDTSANISPAVANWQFLFGSQNGCQCDDCQSVYSHGAYLLETYQLLTPAARDEFNRRRPDIVSLHLNCKNAKTPIPHIDLTNELLEYHLAPKEDFHKSLQVLGDEQSLELMPEHQNPAAYIHLATASYPLSLPFDHWYTEARQLLNYSDFPLYQLVEQSTPYKSPDSNSKQGHSIYRKEQLLNIERTKALLNTTDADYDLIVNTGGSQNYYGKATTLTQIRAKAANPVALIRLIGLDELMPKAEINRHIDDLLDILSCRFIQAGRAEDTPIQIVYADDECNIEAATLANTNLSFFKRLARFERLRRTLGWQPHELQQALTLFNDRFTGNSYSLRLIDDNFMTFLGFIKELSIQSPTMDILELMAWWGPLETGSGLYLSIIKGEKEREYSAGTSFYERNILGRDNQFNQQQLEKLALNTDKTALKISNHKLKDNKDILAILIADTDEACGLAIQLIDSNDTLSLNNLSSIYAVKSIARFLDISIKELASLVDIVGINPFSNEIRKSIEPEILSQTLLFIEYAKLIITSSFSINQLVYLWCHKGLTSAEQNILDEQFEDDMALITRELQAINLALLENVEGITNIELTQRRERNSNNYLTKYLAEKYTIDTELIHPVVSTLVTRDFITLFNSGNDSGQDRRRLSLVLLQIEKAIAIIKGFALKEEDIAYIEKHKISFSHFNWSLLPVSENMTSLLFSQWLSLYQFTQVRDQYSKKSGDITEIFKEAKAGWSDSLKYKISQLFGITVKELGLLLKYLNFPKLIHLGEARPRPAPILPALELKTSPSLEFLQVLGKIVSQTKRLGIPISTYISWKGGKDLSNTFQHGNAQIISEANKALITNKNSIVQSLRAIAFVDKLVQQKHKIALEFQNTLREARRNALLASLIASKAEFHNNTDVYDYFLIDSKINACFKTTRIQQAINTLQQFIERISSGREPGISLTEKHQREWEWRRNYRVWEAHMRIFLYPENWLLPEFRGDKTAFYKTFEDELISGPLNDEIIEKSVNNYVKKLDEISYLNIIAYHTDQENRLHLIGRTRQDPKHYYYRYRDVHQVWTSWQKMDIDIDSDHLSLVSHCGRLHLFWLTFTEGKLRLGLDNDNDKDNETNNYRRYYDIQANWTVFEKDKWSARRTSKEKVKFIYSWNFEEMAEANEARELINLKAESIQNGRNLAIDIFSYNLTYKIITKGEWDQVIIDDLENAIKQQIENRHLNNPKDYHFEIHNSFKKLFKYIVEINFKSIKFLLHQYHIKPEGELFNRCIYLVKLSFNIIKDYRYFKNNGDYALHQWMVGSVCNDRNIKVEASYTSPINSFLYSSENSDVEYGFFGHSDGLNISSLEGFKQFIKFNKKTTKYWVHPRPINGPNKRAYVNRFISGFISEGCVLDVKVIKNRLIGDARPKTFFLPPYFSPVFNKIISPSEAGRLKVDVHENMFIDNETLHENPGYLLESKGVKPILSTNQAKDKFIIDMDWSYYKRSDIIATSRGWETELGYLVYFTEPYTYLSRNSFFEFDHKTFLIANNYFEGFLESENEMQSLFKSESHYLPLIRDLRDELIKKSSIDYIVKCRNVLSLENQKINQDSGVSNTSSSSSISNSIKEKYNFSLTDPYQAYHWELFFYMPLHIAIQLSAVGQYEKAQQWFHIIFNPINTGESVEGDQFTISRFWRFKPLHDMGKPDHLMNRLDLLTKNHLSEDEEDIVRELRAQQYALNRDPFQPHAVARLRLGAYQRFVVMKYIENLIAWGDSLFSRSNLPSILEATRHYSLAEDILGSRPIVLPKTKYTADFAIRDRIRVHSQGRRQRVSEADPVTVLVDIEAEFVASPQSVIGQGVSTLQVPADLGSLSMTLVQNRQKSGFCVPVNDKLLEYWDKVEDRLRKIRNCQNLQGQEIDLPLFAPRIDPELLIRATQAGLSINDILADAFAPWPKYRFNFMLDKAKELTTNTIQLGDALLSALEKRDTEALGLIREKHNKEILELVKDIKTQQIKEIEENNKSLTISLESAKARQQYYTSRKFQNSSERSQISKLNTAHDFQLAAQIVQTASSITNMLPNISVPLGPGIPSLSFGGSNLGAAFQAVGAFLNAIASQFTYEANLLSIQGGQERRMDDWKFQAQQAEIEIKQLDQQIIAAEIRKQIAEQELENHSRQMEQGDEIINFLNSKFTNKQLYNWMVNQLSPLHYQTFNMALETAKMARKCYEIEVPNSQAPEIKQTHWNNLRKGINAGRSLLVDLNTLDKAYISAPATERLKSKTARIELSRLDPLALETFKKTGECEIKIPELYFNLDSAGDYYRRIKTVSLSIPAVSGPNTGVHCRLTLNKSKTRKVENHAEDSLKLDKNVRPESIDLSTGQNDSGISASDSNPALYRPFEYRGVDSEWKLEFTSPYPQFDWRTITDVVMNIEYTKEIGSDAFKTEVENSLSSTVNAITRMYSKSLGMAHATSLKKSFPNDLAAFKQLPDDNTVQTLAVPLSKHQLPYFFSMFNIEVKNIDILFALKSGVDDITITGIKEDAGIKLEKLNDNKRLLRAEVKQADLIMENTKIDKRADKVFTQINITASQLSAIDIEDVIFIYYFELKGEQHAPQ